MSLARLHRTGFWRMFAAAGAACILAAALGGRAFAVDPLFDDMRAPGGPTASQPSDAARKLIRETARAPTLSERFGLPPLSGPLPPLIPPVLRAPSNERNAASPPLPEPMPARRTLGPDG